MQIAFEFQGGYGGLFAARPLSCSLDTDDLIEKSRAEVENLVRDSGLLEQPRVVDAMGAGSARDVFAYRLTLCDGRGERTYRFDDETAPASARPLLRYLRNLAIEEKMGGA